jgi:sigma-B regulation protein RsbU (phosphoserine phosphatase)
MMARGSIAWRMSLLLTLGSAGAIALIVGAGAVYSRRVLEEELEAKARALGTATTYRIEAVERSVAKTADGLALAMEHMPMQRDAVKPLLLEVLKNTPEIFGCAAALEPDTFGLGDTGTALYAYRSGGSLLTKSLEGDYAYRSRDWYTLPMERCAPVWTEPYFDTGGGDILMATYCVPLFSGVGRDRFEGVVTCDVSLEWLAGELGAMPLGDDGYGFLLSHEGTIIVHPTRAFVMRESIFSLAEARKDPALRALGMRMTRGETGFAEFLSLTTRTPSWLAFAPVTSTGWSLGVVFHKQAVMARVNALGWLQLLMGLSGFLFLLLVVLITTRAITRPLVQLDRAVGVMASGDLDAPLPETKGNDEVARLTVSFHKMQTDLKAHIAQLQATTAAKERVARELQIAHNIQMSLVPRTFPPFPRHHDFEIFAVLDPARQIGGDLYDFLLLDDDHLCIVIGDVSGKGIPAALFMAATRSFLRAFFREERDPAVVFARLNDELASQGEANMFVTLFAAIVHLPSGAVRFTNGGHNPPYVLRAEGALDTLPSVGGIIVGAIPDMTYKTGTFHLGPGDTMVLFTDGVTEARNVAGDFFGEERTEQELVRLKGIGAKALVTAMREIVQTFAEGAEQSDDITLMAFKFFGAGG